MRTNFDLAEIVLFVLAAAGFVYALTVAVVQIRRVRRRRNAVRFNYHVVAADGSTHAVPVGQLHDDSDRCSCGPWSKGQPASLLVQHRDLKAVR